MPDTPLPSAGNHPLLAQLYRCWGKTGGTPHTYHPALYHMLDVGHVAQQLLQEPGSPRWCWALGKALGTSPEALANWIPWLVALHDIGKLSATFQTQNPGQLKRLRAEGFSFGDTTSPANALSHTGVGQLACLDELLSTFHPPLPPYLLQALFEMIGGHHGMFATPDDYQNNRRKQRAHPEPLFWSELRHAAASLLKSVFLVQPITLWPTPPNLSVAIMALTGFAILCDWLGSDSHHFPLASATDWQTYIPLSQVRAQNAISAAGFYQPTYSKIPLSFAALFPERPPRPLQKAIDGIPEHLLAYPSRAIIEAPTGEGKTEAALALAHRLVQATGSHEFYCALPTTATSNQMAVRLERYLTESLHLPGSVKLIHSQAMLLDDDHSLSPASENNTAEPHPSLEWFAPRKRALLAPFGVGTVDRVELTALNVPHNALRLIGLAGKVIILDEVHAYDTYMTTIIEQMLRWLAALGCSVILLSATLPTARRKALAEAYGATFTLVPDKDSAYPSLWVGNQNESCHLTPPAHQLNRLLMVGWLRLSETRIDHSLTSAAADNLVPHAYWLLQTVAEGGCACWITNTVSKAHQLYQTLRNLDPTLDCLLIHARFPLEQRQSLEQRLVAQYGPDGKRPTRAIVIGTQVLEQSLDLDFDVMVSDLAPIDLLLQRAGRLHRHTRPRPLAHQEPRFWVYDNTSKAGTNVDNIYPEYLLNLTRLALANRPALQLPTDYRPLVETVYNPTPLTTEHPLFAAWSTLQREQEKARAIAQQRLLPDPTPDRPFTHHNRVTFREDEDSQAWMVGQTRLAPESLTVIPLELDGRVAVIPGTDERFPCDMSAPRAAQLRLLRTSLRVTHPLVVKVLKATPPIALFTQSTLLRTTRPLWLSEGQAILISQKQMVTLKLDTELGLVVSKVEKL